MLESSQPPLSPASGGWRSLHRHLNTCGIQSHRHIGINKKKSSKKNQTDPWRAAKVWVEGCMWRLGGWGILVTCGRDCMDRGIVLNRVGPWTQHLWCYSILEGLGGRQFRIEPKHFLSIQTLLETTRFQHMGKPHPSEANREDRSIPESARSTRHDGTWL